MEIRKSNIESDKNGIWEIIEQVISKGDTWVFDPKSNKEKMFDYWFEKGKYSYVAILENKIVGIFFLKANHPDLGSHIANAGYMVHEGFRGKGVAKSMCEFSLKAAKELGFLAIQFNIVFESNKVAIKLWQKCGFKTIGVIPKAIKKTDGEFENALIMYQEL